MVYLGLSQDETLKNYRLLGQGKDFILLALSHSPSRISVFHFIWSGSFSKPPPPNRYEKVRDWRRWEVFNLKKKKMWLISSLSLCNFIIWELRYQAQVEENIDLSHEFHCRPPLRQSETFCLPEWPFFQMIVLKGGNIGIASLKPTPSLWKLWPLLHQVGSQLALGSIISFQRESTTFSFYRFYLLILACSQLLQHLIQSKRFRVISASSGRHSCVSSVFPQVIFRMPPPPTPLVLGWSGPATGRGVVGERGDLQQWLH